MKKFQKAVKISLTALIAIYILLILFPQLLFANKIEYKSFEVYHHNTINEQKLKSVLDVSEKLLEGSELKSNSETQKLFLTESYNEFTFFALLSKNAFAVNYPVVQNIFFTKSDLSKNLITRNNKSNNRRTLSGVIAHETIHSLLENKIGIIDFKLLPTWKIEGYADYIAKESSYKATNDIDTICKTAQNKASRSYKYFEYRIITEYLLEQRNIELNKFLKNEFELENLKQEVIENYCSQ
ncbi:hypothetical protein LDL76_08560 [Salegentibacter mishustinae]|uniref:hypothetical protein n=1 Tax=Salegentibacter mishustinae TaxID=270918 RepID=UPI001CE22FFF|nr:hypothetical protein [Salegentibacter mishustinae]UBZ08748.1 hypothetical protein LDL76_08560 [Salegentibacter mishustinae]